MSTISNAPTSPASARRPSYRWRVVDIVVASVIAVAVGVIFWAWSAAWPLIEGLTVAFPPAAGLYTGGWLMAGVLGGLIIRKPGAAIYCEMLAAVVSALLGTSFGMTVLVSGLIQGLGAEIVFLLFFYRKFNVVVAMLAGLGAGLALAVSENILYNMLWAPAWQLAYVGFAAVSGVLIAGLLPWLAVKGLARTGVLSSFAAGRTADV